MRTSPRLALVACLSLIALAPLVGACNVDEPATYLPKDGNWLSSETNVVSNSCADDYQIAPLSNFYVDYDEGDSFQIELGQEDVTCEIDGTYFYCSAYVISSGIPGFEAILHHSTTWEGDFLSETEAEGTETVEVTCEGESCSLTDAWPCARVAKFEAASL